MNQPAIGTYNPGTVLAVGSHHAKILKYITSGGFAQIYSAEIFPADTFVDSNVACLKRVIVPDKPSLNTLRAEVDAMKLLKNNKHVVSYIDSHAAKSAFQNGSYEVFMLMEYCADGGLIDFMNTRLQNRLQEYEILNIMSQVTQGIAAMHALQPPLIHRDIKIENVLISHTGEYKVCDFGSVCGIIRPPKNPQELAYVQHDILKNTTAQYRAPEMIDLYRGHAIDEKSDIWALGVFLYKLCYYTTPFEKGGELAILHSRFQFPAQPMYSDRLKSLISLMLAEQPEQRPNVCQTLEEVSRLQGVPCPIRNFYLLRVMEKTSQKQLHYSKTQPILGSIRANPPTAAPMYQLPAAVSLNASSSHLLPSNSAMASRPHSAGNTGTIVPAQVSSVDINRRPVFDKPAMISRDTLRSSPSPVKHGRGSINQIVSSNRTSFDRPGNYVDSVTQTPDVEPSSLMISSSSSTSLASNNIPHNKESQMVRSPSLSSRTVANSYRRSTSPPHENTLKQTSPSLILPVEHKGKASKDHGKVESLSQIEDKNHKTLTPPERHKEAKESIQKRVRELLNSSEDLPLRKPAPVAGKPEKVSQSESTATKSGDLTPDKSRITPKTKTRPHPPPKPAHLRPKPPPKSAALKGIRKTNVGSREEEAAGEAILDAKVEALEKDVRKQVSGTL